jgi:AcrR family transcriptional regulator
MRLSAPDRRQQLINVAMRLFSLQGFDGTTTREIAEAAHVNEAIIFRHFPSKEDLYWAVVSSHIAASGRQQKIRAYLDSGRPEQEIFTDIAESLLDRTSEDAALTRLLLFSALRNSELTDNFFRTYIANTYELISAYVRKGIREGRFRKVDPVIAARGFLGMISNHILLQELFGGARYQKFSSRAVGRQMAETWLNGIWTETSKHNASVNGARRKASAPHRPGNGRINGAVKSRSERTHNSSSTAGETRPAGSLQKVSAG